MILPKSPSVLKVIVHDATVQDVARLEEVLKEFRVDDEL